MCRTFPLASPPDKLSCLFHPIDSEFLKPDTCSGDDSVPAIKELPIFILFFFKKERKSGPSLGFSGEVYLSDAVAQRQGWSNYILLSSPPPTHGLWEQGRARGLLKSYIPPRSTPFYILKKGKKKKTYFIIYLLLLPSRSGLTSKGPRIPRVSRFFFLFFILRLITDSRGAASGNHVFFVNNQ